MYVTIFELNNDCSSLEIRRCVNERCVKDCSTASLCFLEASALTATKVINFQCLVSDYTIVYVGMIDLIRLVFKLKHCTILHPSWAVVPFFWGDEY